MGFAKLDIIKAASNPEINVLNIRDFTRSEIYGNQW
jgi:hypothetical protein